MKWLDNLTARYLHRFAAFRETNAALAVALGDLLNIKRALVTAEAEIARRAVLRKEAVEEWKKRAQKAEVQLRRFSEDVSGRASVEAEKKKSVDAEIKELKRLLHNERATVLHWKSRYESTARALAQWSDGLERSVKAQQDETKTQ